MARTGIYKNMARGIVAIVFRCQEVGGVLKSNLEASDFRWATADEVRVLVAEAFAVRVVDAIDYAGAPAVRQHDGVKLL